MDTFNFIKWQVKDFKFRDTKENVFPIVVIWLLERFKCSMLFNLSNGDNFRKRFELMSNHRSFLQVLTLEIPEENFVKYPTLWCYSNLLTLLFQYAEFCFHLNWGKRYFEVPWNCQFCFIGNGVTAQDLCVYTVSQGYWCGALTR